MSTVSSRPETVDAVDCCASPPALQSATSSGFQFERLSLWFVSAAALVLLVAIVGERMGWVDRFVSSLPPWAAFFLVGVGGYPIFRGLVRDLGRRRVTAHAVMSIGMVAALIAGVYAAAIIIVFFMRVGESLESYTVNRSRSAIRALTESAPVTATVLRGDEEVVVRCEAVQPGETVIVRPGQRIPVDGRVTKGQAEVDQAPITGESVPLTKTTGDRVFAASINQLGYLEVEADRIGADSTFGRILYLVEQAQTSKAPVQRLADKFSTWFAPFVLLVAFTTWMVTGLAMNAVAVLVVSCACAIAIATPMAVAAAVGAGARQGILVKGGACLETLARVDTILVDKTGTLTFGTPSVTDVVPLNDWSREDVLRLTAAVERYSEHPLARAIVAANGNFNAGPVAEDFEVAAGRGVAGRVEGRLVRAGTAEWVGVTVAVTGSPRAQAQEFLQSGKSVVYVSVDGQPAGLIGTADTIRPGVREEFARLRGLGIRHILMVTGDSEQAAASVAKELGIDYVAEALPEDKLVLLRKLQQEGHKVAMVGDGINDAPALAAADVGIAMGAASTGTATAAAIEAADIALMMDDWAQVSEAVRLARRTFSTIRQNLFLTGLYNVVGISLAAVGILPPVFAAAAQSIPDVAILFNSLRLLRVPPR